MVTGVDMAKQHELAAIDYATGMSLKDIAEKYNVSYEAAKKWKQRYKWEKIKQVKKIVKVVEKNVPNVPQKRGTKGDKNTKVQEPLEELTEQEQLFCYHYVRTHNATQAALLAGYAKGNKQSAEVLGCRLYHRPRVKQEIGRLHELLKQDIHVDIQDFLTFMQKVVGADIGDYLRFGMVERVVFGEDGPLTDENGEVIKEPVNSIVLGESEMLDTSVITEVKQGKDGISIKLADKKWAWEQLTKYFDWLPDQWKRKVETEKLDIERQKVDILRQKNGEGGDADDSIMFVDDIGSDDEES